MERTEAIKNIQHKIFERCTLEVNIASSLYSCAACVVKSFQMGNVEYQRFSLSELGILLYNENKKIALFKIDEPYRRIVSYYDHKDKICHLHPEFIEFEFENEDDLSTMICNECTKVIKKNEIPKFSIAAGIDYGNIGRISLIQPNIIESICIARYLTFITVYKLTGYFSNQKQFAQKGHAISYYHDAPEQIASSITFPRVDNISDYLTVCFVGAKFKWVAFQPSFKVAVPDLVVRPQVIYDMLYALKKVNPLYKDIIIVDDADTRQKLNNITDDLIKKMKVMDEEILQNIEKELETTTASYGVSGIPFNCSASEKHQEKENSVENGLISHSFVNNSNYVNKGPLDPVTFICSSFEQAILNNDFSKKTEKDCFNIDQSKDEQENMEEEIYFLDEYD